MIYLDDVKKMARERGLTEESAIDAISAAIEILKKDDPRAFLKIMRATYEDLSAKEGLQNGLPEIAPTLHTVSEKAKNHIFEQLMKRWHMQQLAAQCAPDLALAHAAIQMLVDMNDGEPNWLSYLEETLLDLSNQKREDNHTKNLTDSLKSI
jgi:protein-disulfide isomerase-like protein with CxxC motif